MGLYRLALETALEHDLSLLAANTASNLSDLCFHRDRYSDSLDYLDRSLALSRRGGSRFQEWFARSEQSYALTMLGRWDEALARAAELPVDLVTPQFEQRPDGRTRGPPRAWRARSCPTGARSGSNISRLDDVQASGGYHGGLAAVRAAEGRYRDALAAAEHAIAGRK